jgi:hypothetical protein
MTEKGFGGPPPARGGARHGEAGVRKPPEEESLDLPSRAIRRRKTRDGNRQPPRQPDARAADLDVLDRKVTPFHTIKRIGLQ